MKINITLGQGIMSCSFQTDGENKTSCFRHKTAKNKETRRGIQEDSNGHSDEYSLRDSDSELVISDTTEEADFDHNQPSEVTSMPVRSNLKINYLSPGTLVIVDLIFIKNIKKEVSKQFYGQVTSLEPQSDQLTVKFLRKSSKCSGNLYVFPIVDILEVDMHHANFNTCTAIYISL